MPGRRFRRFSGLFQNGNIGHTDRMSAEPDILSVAPPQLGADLARELMQRHWGLEAQALLPLSSERDCNYRVDAGDARFVLKLANQAEPTAVTRLQTAALLHVEKAAPGLPVPRIRPTLAAAAEAAHEGSTLRLLTWLDGLPLAQAARSRAQRTNIAQTHARLALALSGFRYEAAKPHLQWDIQHALALAAHLDAVADDLRDLCAKALARFREHAAPHLPQLRRQFGHCDLNPFNILVSPQAPDEVAGFLDFGDMVETPLACDLAIAAAYQLDAEAAPWAPVCEYASAFHALLPLQETEIAILPELVMARLVTTITITSWRARRYPENRDYILRNQPAARAGLARLLAVPRAQVLALLMEACR